MRESVLADRFHFDREKIVCFKLFLDERIKAENKDRV